MSYLNTIFFFLGKERSQFRSWGRKWETFFSDHVLKKKGNYQVKKNSVKFAKKTQLNFGFNIRFLFSFPSFFLMVSLAPFLPLLFFIPSKIS